MRFYKKEEERTKNAGSILRIFPFRILNKKEYVFEWGTYTSARVVLYDMVPPRTNRKRRLGENDTLDKVSCEQLK